MSVKLDRSVSAARWISRTLKISCVTLSMGLAACVAGVGEDEPSDEEVAERLRAAGVNLCAGQAANTFQCIDDTRFQHCVGPTDTRIFVNSCPAGLCATRTPATGNPCIGRERAAQIDGVQPPPPGAPGIVNNPPPPPPPPPVDEDEEEEEVAPPPPPPPVVNNPPPGGAGGSPDGALPPRDGRTNLRDQFRDQVRDGADGSNAVGRGIGTQFITGQCFSNADCAANANGTPTAGCARRAARAPVRTQFEGVCSGLAVCGSPGNPVNGKEGCGFDQRLGR
jgi:hypothetical protein